MKFILNLYNLSKFFKIINYKIIFNFINILYIKKFIN